MIKRIRALSTTPRLTWAILAVGVVLRLIHYLHCCSLSVDESHLTLNVLPRSYAELFEPLSDRQGAPIGYLLLLKAVIGLLGDSEYALRSIALVAGIASLFVFRTLAIRFLSPAAVPIAVGLFAVAGQLIFYSAQVKQYASDVLFALLLYLFMDKLIQARRRAPWQMLLYGLFAALAIWSSHPAVFVVGGLGVGFLYFHVLRTTGGRRFDFIIVIALSGASVVGTYLLSLRGLTDHGWLLDFWKDDFMPIPPTSLLEVQWYVVAFFQMFSKMLGFSMEGICGLVMVVGCSVFFTSNRERLASLLLPSGLALFASGLHLYPFCCRLILFTAPALLLLMAEGTVAVVTAARSRPVVGVALVSLLFLHPVMWAGYHVVKPRYEEDLKPALSHLRDNWRPGDVIYLYYRAVPAFTYYAERYGFDIDDCCTRGVDSRYDWNGYRHDLDHLRGNARVWVVFSHIYRWVNVDDEALFLYLLDNRGQRLDSLSAHGASVFLYDLRPPTVAPDDP